MAIPVEWVRTVQGIPAAEVFGNTRGQGTPIVIDESTGTAYYFGGTPKQVRVLAGGGGGGGGGPFIVLTDAATIVSDASLGSNFIVTLTANRVLALPSGMTDGGVYNFWIRQDSVGNRSLSFASGFSWPGQVAPIMTPTANAIDLLTFQYNQALNKLLGSYVMNYL